MKALLFICLAQLTCACTPHEVRCDGRLEPINTSRAETGGTSATAAGSVSEIP